MIDVIVEDSAFDVNALYSQCRSGSETGAVVFFSGQVRQSEPRQTSDGELQYLQAMQIEHYAGMTESAIEAICHKALERWLIQRCVVRHRVGILKVGEPIVLVMVASPHRKDAFEACEFIMDFLKTEAPFWKKALFADGSEWVEARRSDEDQLAKWNESENI